MRKKNREWRNARKKIAVEDLINIIIGNNVFQKKLFFTKEKNVTKSWHYEQVIQELKERRDARGEDCYFDVP